jgi:hypothetical protein
MASRSSSTASRKTQESLATLAIYEPEAAVVRTMFERFEGGEGINAICRWLQLNNIKTRYDKSLWSTLQVRNILKCRTYTGERHFRLKNTSDAVVPKHKRGSAAEPSETICMKVPPIVSPELFEKVQAKLLQNTRRYKQPAVHHLLKGLIECGECGCGFHSYRRYTEKSLLNGSRRLAHKAAYKCNWRTREKQHLLDRVTRCHNPEVATHLLEGKVMEMIRDTLLVSEKLQTCIEGLESGRNDKHDTLVRKLERFNARIASVETEKRKSIELYAAGRLAQDAYAAMNLTLDREIQRLRKRTAQFARELDLAAGNDMVEKSIREYCARAKERL